MSEYQKGLVSIVVPTYFSESYLEKCLDCLVHQTYPEVEVIICDGDSRDGTLAVIEKYERKYDFVRCLRMENRGVSASRNAGIEAAKGEYLEFVDSDDFLLPTACETMVRAMEDTGSDVVIAGFRMLKTGEERCPVEGIYNGITELMQHLDDYYYYKRNCFNTPWNKLYKREGLLARFPEELSMGEDLMFNVQVFEKAKKITVISELVYEYNNVNDQSLAYRYRENGFEIETMLHKKMLEMAEKYESSDKAVLYQNYIFGLKTKMTALIHKSGLSGRKCRQKLRSWTENEAVRELITSYRSDSRKDRILFFMLKHHMKTALYWYYRLMA